MPGQMSLLHGFTSRITSDEIRLHFIDAKLGKYTGTASYKNRNKLHSKCKHFTVVNKTQIKLCAKNRADVQKGQ